MGDVLIRDAVASDHAAILALNLADEAHTSALDAGRLAALDGLSCLHRVACLDGAVCGFLLAMRDGVAYENDNYAWFSRRPGGFVYVDRVVIAASARGQRLGTLLYDDLFGWACRHGIPAVACEYNIDPPNEPSRRFHDKFGFREQGTQWVAGRTKRVSLQVAESAQWRKGRTLVRPFASREDYAAMVGYFLDGGEAFQRGMGVDPARLPQREAWIDAALADHDRPKQEKERSYLAWEHEGRVVGHSSIGRISLGHEAYIHLHLWDPALRRQGLGSWYFRQSAREFARSFGLRRICCEPYADNPAPNRALLKAGFRFVRRHRTVPGAINFEQDVNHYVLDRPAELEVPDAPGT